MKKTYLALVMTAVAMAMAGNGWAADPVKERVQTETRAQVQTQSEIQVRDQERIYGSQLMTEQERNAYRVKMQAAKTEQAREALRHEHHEEMQKRAKAKGMTLPDEPPPQGAGMGVGAGAGKAMGTGAGGGYGRHRR